MTPTSFFKRLVGSTQTIEAMGSAVTFRPTGELVPLLLERARQLRRAQRGGNNLLPRVWPGKGYDRPAIG
jgi:hypothetical protein